MSLKTTDVAIIGGGVVGCCLAYYLSAAGLSVTVIDRDQPGGQAPMLLAGILAPSAEAGAPGPFCELGMASYLHFPRIAAELRQELSIDIDLDQAGGVRVAWTDQTAQRLKDSERWERERGIDLTWLDGDDLRRLEPSLSPELAGGLYTALMSHVLTPRLIQGYIDSAARRGATFLAGHPAFGLRREGARIIGVDTPAGTISAGHVIVSTGAWGGLYQEWLGAPLPIKPRKGQLMLVQTPPSQIRRAQRIIYDGHNYMVPKRDGTVVIGATEEDAAFDRRVTLDGLSFLTRMAARAIPSLAQAELRGSFAGFRPMPTDELPIIGLAPGTENLIFATGHYRNGILLGPITGELVTQIVRGETPSVDLQPFSPSRFSASQ
ncbi:MAG: glycine oxidase ThiO [Chloroflexota bacterium]